MLKFQNSNNCFSCFYCFLHRFLVFFCPGQFKKQQANPKCKIIQVFQKLLLIDPLNLIHVLLHMSHSCFNFEFQKDYYHKNNAKNDTKEKKTQKTTTQILNPKKIEIYPCPKPKIRTTVFLVFIVFLHRFLVFFCPGQFKKQQANPKCKIIQVFQKLWLIDPLNLIPGLSKCLMDWECWGDELDYGDGMEIGNI